MKNQPENITSPIIVIGMHRSGTTLLTRMLEVCGVFWGTLPDEYNESAFFQFSNEALFAMASATWDAPASMEHFLGHPDNQKKGSDFLQKRLKEDFCSEYCCGLRSNRTFQTDLLPAHWGWKDPRNVYTLGLWLIQFPNARVIHIIRSGIYTIVFSTAVTAVSALDDRPINYGLFIFAGMLPWLSVQNSIRRCATIMVDLAQLIRHNTLPLGLLPLHVVLKIEIGIGSNREIGNRNMTHLALL